MISSETACTCHRTTLHRKTWEPHMTTNITKFTRAAGMAAVESGLLFRNQ